MDSQRRISTIALVIVAVLAMAFAAFFAAKIFLPFVLAFFVAIVIAPVINFLKKEHKFPEWLAVASGIFLAGMFFSLLSFLVVFSLRRIVTGVNFYRQRLVSMADQVIDFLSGYGVDLDRTYLLEQIGDLSIFRFVAAAAGRALSFSSSLLLVFIFVVFLLVGKSFLRSNGKVIQSLTHTLRRYLIVKSIISLITALLVGFTFEVLNLDMAWIFALITFTLNFIPTIGSIVAVLIPIPVAVVQFTDWLPIVLVLLVPMVIQFVLGSIIDPMIVGERVKLHPVTVLLSLLISGLIWGVLGMFLAVPIIVTIKILLSETNFGRDLMQLFGFEADKSI